MFPSSVNRIFRNGVKRVSVAEFIPCSILHRVLRFLLHCTWPSCGVAVFVLVVWLRRSSLFIAVRDNACSLSRPYLSQAGVYAGPQEPLLGRRVELLHGQHAHLPSSPAVGRRGLDALRRLAPARHGRGPALGRQGGTAAAGHRGGAGGAGLVQRQHRLHERALHQHQRQRRLDGRPGADAGECATAGASAAGACIDGR